MVQLKQKRKPVICIFQKNAVKAWGKKALYTVQSDKSSIKSSNLSHMENHMLKSQQEQKVTK